MRVPLHPAEELGSPNAAQSGVTKQAVGEFVDELEGYGYVERIPDPLDGRAKIIRLTERGRDARLAALRIFEDMERDGPSGSASARSPSCGSSRGIIEDRIGRPSCPPCWCPARPRFPARVPSASGAATAVEEEIEVVAERHVEGEHGEGERERHERRPAEPDQHQQEETPAASRAALDRASPRRHPVLAEAGSSSHGHLSERVPAPPGDLGRRAGGRGRCCRPASRDACAGGASSSVPSEENLVQLDEAPLDNTRVDVRVDPSWRSAGKPSSAACGTRPTSSADVGLAPLGPRAAPPRPRLASAGRRPDRGRWWRSGSHPRARARSPSRRAARRRPRAAPPRLPFPTSNSWVTRGEVEGGGRRAGGHERRSRGRGAGRPGRDRLQLPDCIRASAREGHRGGRSALATIGRGGPTRRYRNTGTSSSAAIRSAASSAERSARPRSSARR